MPRTHYQQTEATGDPKLARLAALAQLGQTLQQPQLQQQQADAQQHQQMIASAIQMMGLQQQQQNEQAMQVFRQQQENNRQGEYWGGALPREYAAQDATTQHYADESARGWAGNQVDWARQSAEDQRQQALAQHQINQDTIATSQNQRALDIGLLGEVQKNTPVGQTNPLVNDIITRLSPNTFGPAIAQRHQEAVQSEVAAKSQLLSTTTKPEMRKQLLQSMVMNPQMHPDVRNQLLQQFGPQAQQPATGPTTQVMPQANSDISNPDLGRQALELMRQQDPQVYQRFPSFKNHIMGEGSAFEGSPLYNYMKQQNDVSKKAAEAALLPYIFQLIGKQPVNLNQA